MIEPPKVDVNEYDKGRLSEDIYLVKRGVRPAALIPIRKSLLETALRMVKEEGLLALAEPCGESHIAFMIYAHPHLTDLIPQIDALQGPLRDWAHGKLFGYSEEAIGQFLAKGREADATLP